MLRKVSISVMLLVGLVGLLPGARAASPPAQPGDCGNPATLIHEVQGTGTRAELIDQMVTIEGVVTGDFQANDELQGFYMQEEPDDADDNERTSEGVFVYDAREEVALGDVVRVTGKVAEYEALTEISDIEEVVICGTADVTIEPVVLTFPVAALGDLERYEHMLVTIPQEMTVTELYTLLRYGEIALSADGRLYQPTNVARPGPAADAIADENRRRTIILDDGSTKSNLDPTRFPAGGLSADNVLRVGDTVMGVTGVLDERFDSYRIEALATPTFVASNPRPDAPAAVDGRLRVASFNVLNYFNGDGAGKGFPTSRGADTKYEFTRQQDKLVHAILALDADVVGLIEIENDGDGPDSALAALVDALNAAAGEVVYAYVDDPVGLHLPDAGGDEIKQAIIYRPAAVQPVGDALATLKPPFDSRRPPVAQAFEEVASGEVFMVVVNHFKSKGCDGADDVGDGDSGDGQGCWNAERTLAAQTMIDWLASDPSGTGDADVLLIGDLNAYTMEDPMMTLADAGYTDLAQVYEGSDNYSYVYDGWSGSLDHALASASLVGQVTGTTTWHINADEPIAFDYNIEYKSGNLINSLYDPGPFRSSDHDPVIIGLALQGEKPDTDPTLPADTPDTPTEAPTTAPTDAPTVVPTSDGTPGDEDDGGSSAAGDSLTEIVITVVGLVLLVLVTGLFNRQRKQRASQDRDDAPSSDTPDHQDE